MRQEELADEEERGAIKLDFSKIYHVPKESDINEAVTTVHNILDYNGFRLFRSFCRKQIIGLFVSCKQTEIEREILFPFIKDSAGLLKKKDVWAFICDTSNRHKNINSNALEQIENITLGKQSNLHSILPFFMLDGINGNYEYIVNKGKKESELFLGGELPNLDGLVVFSVPHKHDLCGIAGSLFSLGAGLASKRGKIKLYTQDKPKVNVKKCYACRRCIHECPVNAIKMGNRHVVIDSNMCVDCGRCVEIARLCGISYDWNASSEYFQNRMLQQAEAVMDLMRKKMIFISIIPDKDEKLEIVISRDPVSADNATLEILRKNSMFDNISFKAFYQQIEESEKLEIGTKYFKQEDIAY